MFGLLADEFEPATENVALKALIADRIRRQGTITFRDFMDLTLYHPQHGYYSSHRRRTGRHGDYLTSPEVHPVFGYLVAKQVWQIWKLMGRPQPFTVVEMGPGRGLLCRDILRWAKTRAPDLYGALSYCMVQRGDHVRQEALWNIQQANVDMDRITWAETLPQGVVGCFLSNELVDSFPVHRVAVIQGELQ
ncbi:MAG: SAM-dependent methyltransferase, partial [Dehalococcoidia bacterium]